MATNRTCRADSRRIEDWLIANWASIETDKPFKRDIAAKCGKALNLTLTPGNITGAAKAIGKDLPAPVGKLHGVAASGANRKKLAVLAAEIYALQTALGVKPSKPFAELFGAILIGDAAVAAAAGKATPKM